MKNKISSLLTLVLSGLPFLNIQGEVRLPRFICDGMVLQRNDTARVWGQADPGEAVTVSFLKKKYTAVADPSGQWMVNIPTTSQKKGGGPYTMDINGQQLKDVYVGDVWLCSGQSNMDLHTARLVDLYKDEFDHDSNPAIHLMQTARTPAINGPQQDVQGHGGYYAWESMKPENVGHWSGLGYFYAKEMYKRTGGVPQGIINCSMGGSDIVAWISADELEKVAPKYNTHVKHLKQPGYLERCSRLNRVIGEEYNRLLAEDPGLKENWMAEQFDDSQWKEVNQYDKRLWDDNGRPWCGTLWLRKTFDVPADMVGKDSLLRLGCLVDADETYVNGVKVGEVTYQYPPRKYTLPKGLLHTGRNVVCIRLRTNGGGGEFVSEKPYRLFFHGGSSIDLEGTWKINAGVLMPRQPGTEGVNNACAASLYDNTIYPLRHYTIAGILWNQGETNAGRPDEYRQLLPIMISNWRQHFGQVPAVIFGLANYMERHADPNYNGGWAKIREAQRLAVQEMDRAALVTAIDLGEWNDIHPLNKKESARRAALQMQRLYLGAKEVGEGPMVSSVTYQGREVRVKFLPGTALGLELRDAKPHSQAQPLLTGCGFSVAGADGKWFWANARVEDSELVVWSDQVAEPRAIRYAWDDDPIVTLFNGQGLPAAPFQYK